MRSIKRIALLAALLCTPLPVEAAQKIHFLDGDYLMHRANLTGKNYVNGAWILTGAAHYAPHVDWLYNPGTLYVGWLNGAITAETRPGDYQELKASGSEIDAIVLRPGVELIYATNNPVEIRRIKLDGTGDSFRFVPPGGRVSDLAIVGSTLYWTNGSGIHRSTVVGTSHTVIRAGDYSFFGLDVDTTHIYYASFVYPNIGRVKLDGSGLVVIVSNVHVGYPRLDRMGKVYWIDSYSRKIRRANADGSDVETILTDTNVVFSPWTLSVEVGPWSCEQTAVYGDIVAPFGGPVSPDFKDISEVVQCFLDNCTELRFDKADLKPCWNSTSCAGDGRVDFKDINYAVGLFLGTATCP